MASARNKITIIQKKDWTIDGAGFLSFKCPHCSKRFRRPIFDGDINKYGVVRLGFYCTPSTGGCEHLCKIRLYGWVGIWKKKGAS